jgi:phage shock protein PspC (stress-responsive transcriptional regulator)
MNKTVTINISGIIFHIEEDAYANLNLYLSAIKAHFSRTDGGTEILSDIEARIAELLQEKITPSKQVILNQDVEAVKGIMGRPEDFGAEPSPGLNNEEQNFSEVNGAKVKRRLFRNPDEKAIGGVCSGLAAYLDIDTVWVRLAMFLLIFFGGLSLWVYIILWIVIPEARTTADKFAMRGESANINNIFRSFKEEAVDVKNRFRDQKYGERIRSNASGVLNTFFNIIGRLLGLLFIFFGTILLLCLAASLIGFSFMDVDDTLGNWKSVIFDSSSTYNLGVLAFFIVLAIPVFMLLYVGIKMLFRIRYSNRWLNLSLGILWLLGLLLGFYVTMATVKEFKQSSRLKEMVTLHNTGDTIRVSLNPTSMAISSFPIDHKDDLESELSSHHNGYRFAQVKDKISIIGYANLDVVETNSDSVELLINYCARGATKKEANEYAKMIRYSYVQNNNELVFDEIFRVIEGVKFRSQEVDIKLRLPRGKVIYFDKSVKYLLNDVDNISNSWDGDMVGRRWIMTANGLKCIDCEGLRDNSIDNIRSRHPRIPRHPGHPGHPGHGNSDDAEVKINDEGIRIRTEDGNIDITDDGININTKNKEGRDKDGE